MRWFAFLLLPLLMAAAPFDPFGQATIDERPGATIPMNDRLIDANGRAVTLAEIAKGRPLLLVPVLHQCPNFCGVTLDGVLDVAGKTPIVAFGIDPREGRAAARADLDRLLARHPRAANNVMAVTGDQAVIMHVSQALGYRFTFDPATNQYAHVAATAVLTPDGHLVRWLYGIAPTPKAVRLAVADAQAGRTGGIIDRLILLCYHYDAARGSYGLAIDRLLRASCLATVLALLFYVLHVRWRERRPC